MESLDEEDNLPPAFIDPVLKYNQENEKNAEADIYNENMYHFLKENNNNSEQGVGGDWMGRGATYIYVEEEAGIDIPSEKTPKLIAAFIRRGEVEIEKEMWFDTWVEKKNIEEKEEKSIRKDLLVEKWLVIENNQPRIIEKVVKVVERFGVKTDFIPNPYISDKWLYADARQVDKYGFGKLRRAVRLLELVLENELKGEFFDPPNEEKIWFHMEYLFSMFFPCHFNPNRDPDSQEFTFPHIMDYPDCDENNQAYSNYVTLIHN